MTNPFTRLETAIENWSQRKMLAAINGDTPPKRSGPEIQDPLTPDELALSQSLAKDLAGCLVLSGLPDGSAASVNGRYYSLSCAANQTTNPVDRATAATLMYGQYNLATATDTFGGEPRQFLLDYPDLLAAYSTRAGHQIIVDRYPVGVYLKAMSAVISTTQSAVRSTLARVCIPVFVCGIAKAVLGIAFGASSPITWACTAVIAGAGLVNVVGSIRRGVASVRQQRTLAQEVDRSLGTEREACVTFLMNESNRLKAVPSLRSSAVRFHVFLAKAVADLRAEHKAYTLPQAEVARAERLIA